MKKVTLLLVQLLIVFSSFSQDVIKYTTTNLRMRSDTTTTSEIITVIPNGTSVTLSEDCTCDWILVSYQGKTGYVSSKYLTKTKPAGHIDHGPVKYYTNSAGERVQSPTHYNSAPEGATALCRDGTYSFSRSRRGTCSHHGGVARWL